MFHRQQRTGFAAHRISPDLSVSQQVEQSPRAEEAEGEGGTTKQHKATKDARGVRNGRISELSGYTILVAN
jgi:hypothetical protein